MRRTLLILSMFLYLTSNSHLSMAFHFCCGELVNWGLNSEAKGCCENAAAKKSCCSDFELTFGVSDQHACSQNFTLETGVSTIQTLEFPMYTSHVVRSFDLLEIGHVSHAPPNLYTPDFYLLYEVFLI